MWSDVFLSLLSPELNDSLSVNVCYPVFGTLWCPWAGWLSSLWESRMWDTQKWVGRLWRTGQSGSPDHRGKLPAGLRPYSCSQHMVITVPLTHTHIHCELNLYIITTLKSDVAGPSGPGLCHMCDTAAWKWVRQPYLLTVMFVLAPAESIWVESTQARTVAVEYRQI